MRERKEKGVRKKEKIKKKDKEEKKRNREKRRKMIKEKHIRKGCVSGTVDKQMEYPSSDAESRWLLIQQS